MSGQINPRLTPEQMFNLIDRNGNKKIDKDDNLELAKMFGLKVGDTKINEKKVQDFDNKASVFSSVVKRDNSVTVNGSGNTVEVIHGNDNEAVITLPEDQAATFTPTNGEFSDEAKFALMKKGLDPAQIYSAGFTEIEQQVTEDGETVLILKSSQNDGYSLKISEAQENATIARDENGNLKLDGVHGELTIQPSQARSHEVILSNIYDDDVPSLTINNKSGVPLTRTFPCDDKGHLSFDAAKALATDTGFPEGEALHGGFTQVSITDDPMTHQCNIHMESNIHGFKMDVDGNRTQWDGMSINYNKNKNELSIEKLGSAYISIEEDGAREHRIDFSNVDQVHVENKTKKPVHVHESVIDSDDNATRDKSSFTYTTTTNFDTFQREVRKHLTTNISSDGVIATHTAHRSCACNGKHSWSQTVGSVVGAFDFEIDWGSVIEQKPEIKLAPGSFVVQPKQDDYSEYEKTVKLQEGNKRNIGYVTIRDYIDTKERIRQDNTGTVGSDQKIGRSGRDWNGLGIDNIIEDNSVTVNGDNNKVIVIFGDNNIAHIDADGNHMSEQARTILSENYHLNTNMLDKAGFTQVDFVRNENGEISEITLTNVDGTKLTMPSDEAFLFSEQMNITKGRDGVYHVSGMVGRFEGSGMKIDCTQSNVDLTVIEHDPENGYLVYSTHDDDKNNRDGIHVNYSTADGSPARVYQNEVKEKSKAKDDGTKTYSSVDITYPIPKRSNGTWVSGTRIT